MIKTILFDMGNVLVDYSPFYIVSKFTKKIDDIHLLVSEIFLKQEWIALDHGSIDETQLIKSVKPRLPKRLHPTLIKIIEQWDNHFLDRPEMLTLVKQLNKKGIKLILASNAGLRFDRFSKRIKALNYFQDIVVSAKINISKPDPKFFSYILKKHSLKAKECLFVDDITSNVVGAMSVGINGFFYNGNFELFKNYLKTLKVL